LQFHQSTLPNISSHHEHEILKKLKEKANQDDGNILEKVRHTDKNSKLNTVSFIASFFLKIDVQIEQPLANKIIQNQPKQEINSPEVKQPEDKLPKQPLSFKGILIFHS